MKAFLGLVWHCTGHTAFDHLCEAWVEDYTVWMMNRSGYKTIAFWVVNTSSAFMNIYGSIQSSCVGYIADQSLSGCSLSAPSQEDIPLCCQPQRALLLLRLCEWHPPSGWGQVRWVSWETTYTSVVLLWVCKKLIKSKSLVLI